MYSKPFVCTLPDGTRIAVVLVDTQVGMNMHADGRRFVPAFPICGTLRTFLPKSCPNLASQGTFDKMTTLQENTRIFAFNALVSSLQIYNFKDRLDDNILDVRHLWKRAGGGRVERPSHNC